MTASDGPSNPFGRGERTIVVPNPGGWRSGAAAAAAPASGAQADAWISSPPPPKPAGAAAPAGAAPWRGDLVAPSANPLLRAATPLLLMLGRLRVSLLRASFANLMENVAEQVEAFDKDVRAASVPEAQARSAKYVLCATADDIVQNLPGHDLHVWTQYSMLSRFFGERIGGVRFFDELERAKADPVVNYDLLELMHACLALGFQGLHRTSAGGPVALQQIQRNLYETLRRVRAKPTHDLSPRWQGQALFFRAARSRVPFWAAASLSSVLLFALFVTLRAWLGGGAEFAAQEALALHPTTPVAIARRAPAPPLVQKPKPSTQLDCMRRELAAEIAAGTVSISPTPSQYVIRVANALLFASGEAALLPAFAPVAPRLAAALDCAPGTIRVTGHTDSTPIKTVRFPSNFHLSLERARAVSAVLKQRLARPDRIEVAAKGADAPVAPNTTAEGRARNRRVDIALVRSD